MRSSSGCPGSVFTAPTCRRPSAADAPQTTFRLGGHGRLREFEDAQALAEERQQILTSSNPFGIGEYLESFTVDSYAPFPFLPPVQTGRYGDVYEFRIAIPTAFSPLR